jgi:hypothetical protein
VQKVQRLAYLLTTGAMKRHLKIYEDFQEVMALSDKMQIRYDFEALFEVKLYEREYEREGWNRTNILYIWLYERWDDRYTVIQFFDFTLPKHSVS